MKKLIPLTFLLTLLSLAMAAQTIVERHGQLRVKGNKIVDACDRPTQLKGMSYFWSQWENNGIYNESSVKWLRDDWRAQLVRAAVGVNDGDGIDYISKPAENLARATAVLDGAVKYGVYGIADFHAHYANKHLPEAKTFFNTISRRYGSTPNIIYEIWNEPIGDGGDDASARRNWAEVKAYAREVISVIRDNDPDGIIVVGTPFYSQRVDIATADPLTTDSKGRPVGNVAYTLHFYAGTHKQGLRDVGDIALNRGFALMMTEGGRTSASGSGGLDPAEWDRWEAWMDANGISYAKWSMAAKAADVGSSVLEPGASVTGGWTNAQLTAEGEWTRARLRSANANPPSVCGGGGGGGGGSANRAPVVSIALPTSKTVTEGYGSLLVRVNASDPDGDKITATLSIDGRAGRTESAAPYEWGHATTPQPNETKGLAVGTHAFKVVVTDARGKSATASFTLTVNARGGGGNCAYGTPTAGSLPATQATYKRVDVLGSGGPALANVRELSVNWDLRYDGLYVFAFNTTNGRPDWFVDLRSKMNYRFKGARPEVTFSGSGFPGLDGAYWVARDGANLALVSKGRGFTLYFSNRSSAPNCGLSARGLDDDAVALEIFPNPVTDQLTVTGLPSGDTYEASILDAVGKRVVTGARLDAVGGLDVSALPAGMYVLEVRAGATVYTERFVHD